MESKILSAKLLDSIHCPLRKVSWTLFLDEYILSWLLISNRCKSYELGALIEKLLGKPVDKRFEVDCEAMKQAYANSKSLITAAGLSLQDAADTLQVCSTSFWLFWSASWVKYTSLTLLRCGSDVKVLSEVAS